MDDIETSSLCGSDGLPERPETKYRLVGLSLDALRPLGYYLLARVLFSARNAASELYAFCAGNAGALLARELA